MRIKGNKRLEKMIKGALKKGKGILTQRWPALVFGVLLLVFVVCSVEGYRRMPSDGETVPATQMATQPAETTAFRVMMRDETDAAQTEETSETETQSEEAPQPETQAPKVIRLSSEEVQALNMLKQRLDENNRIEAAAVLINNQELFRNLFYNTLDGDYYLYDGAHLKGELAGDGIVLTRPSTVFRGHFSDGVPSGEVLALQVLSLEKPRYDYSMGQWTNGKMNGFGTSGYDYYQGSEGEENKEVEKQGVFVDDLMNGEIIYTSTNSVGSSTSWNLSVLDGVTQIDYRWNYDEKKRTFSLLSENDTTHAFVIEEAVLGDSIFRNMIPWEPMQEDAAEAAAITGTAAWPESTAVQNSSGTAETTGTPDETLVTPAETSVSPATASAN